MNTRPPYLSYLSHEKPVNKQQLELDMEQMTGSKLGKECHKAVYCHSAYLTCMQNASYELPSWINHKLESRSVGEILTTLDIQMITTLMAESEEELKDLVMNMKEKSEKTGLKLNVQ